MDALAATHDTAVQMVDTSIVRVHQHGGCIAGTVSNTWPRSRGGLTTKIHAVVDTNGLPVQIGLTPGEAHDNRLCSVLLSELSPRTMLLADRGMMRTGSGRLPVSKARRPTSRRNETARSLSTLARIFTGRVTWSSVSLTRSSNVGTSQSDMTNLLPTTLPLSSSHLFGFGYALMSPRPSRQLWSTTF
jgi:transposase